MDPESRAVVLKQVHEFRLIDIDDCKSLGKFILQFVSGTESLDPAL